MLVIICSGQEQVTAAVSVVGAILHIDRNFLTPTIGGRAVSTFNGQTHLVLLGDDVDYAGDGVRAIGRGRAAGDDFDPLDQRRRNRIEAYCGRTVLIGHGTPTIDQHQGPIGSLVTQRHGRQTSCIDIGLPIGVACPFKHRWHLVDQHLRQ